VIVIEVKIDGATFDLNADRHAGWPTHGAIAQPGRDAEVSSPRGAGRANSTSLAPPEIVTPATSRSCRSARRNETPPASSIVQGPPG
jgi:hypothetical protein